MKLPPRLKLRFNRRIAAVALHDVVMSALSFEAALALRYWLTDESYSFLRDPINTGIFAGVCAVVFQFTGLYRGIWHYASLRDLMAIMRSAALSLLVFLPILFWLSRLQDYPRSVVAIQFVLLCLLLAGPRLLYRAWKDGSLVAALSRTADRRIPVLLIGSGPDADAFIRQMQRDRQSAYRVVGILDEKTTRQGRDVRGVRVLGGLQELTELAARFRSEDRPRRAILADTKLSGPELAQFVDAAGKLGITVARLPRLTDFRRQGSGSGSGAGMQRLDLRAVDVEDLLGRAQQALDREAVLRLVLGKRVLITGAGGTIGAELTRQVAALEPAAIALFEQSEHALYQIDLEMAERFGALPRQAMLGDVRDAGRVDAVFAAFKPDIVLHAAAYKHVPLTEGNIAEAVRTNVLGTRLVAEAAARHGVAVMVLISTDKAVNPTNVMGASKRVAEMVGQALDVSAHGRPHMVVVRFGNVLGSSGSVVPLFQRQLAQGGPLTVTHPEVTRYFMTTREAVELILQAAALPSETLRSEGKIFVLDMGEPVRIQDLARQMIQLAGLKPDVDVKIVYTGLRPGEKLYEEVLHRAEALQPTPQPGLLLAAPRLIDCADLEAALESLLAAAARCDEPAVLAGLKALVPEFQHAPQGQDKLGQDKLGQDKPEREKPEPNAQPAEASSYAASGGDHLPAA